MNASAARELLNVWAEKPFWISYADLITLLFALFVVMYAVSIVNEGKYKVLSDALGDAFGGRKRCVYDDP